MPYRTSRDAAWSVPLPLTALEIGLWEDNESFTGIHGDPVFARMYGLTESEAAQGITFVRLQSIIHPDDLDHDRDHRRRMRKTGGLFVWEHRIIPRSGVVRWVLVRGHFERDQSGRMRSRGIAIDITHTRSDGYASGPAHFLEAREPAGSPLEAIAEYGLKIHGWINDLDAEAAARLLPLAQALLIEIGHEVAASLPEGAAREAVARSCDGRVH